MRKNDLKLRILFFAAFASISSLLYSQDPNFYIYLCFGQSNMEGQGVIEDQDKTVNERFQLMSSLDCSNLNRTKAAWYPAIPPLNRCWSGLSPADYFGRTMVEYLPDSIKIGIINVSVPGCKIELFDKDNYQGYAATAPDWMKNIINEYGGNPYAHLLEIAQLAQKDGVIKGFLLHQGESNTGDNTWPSQVKTVYDNLISDLSLNADSIPLLAGEVVHADQDGVCASMNSIIATLPNTIPNSYIISSSGCTAQSDNLHFNSMGYRRLGIRYAIQMLSLLGIDEEISDEPYDPKNPEGTESFYFEPECAEIGSEWILKIDPEASNGSYVTVNPDFQSINDPPSTAEGEIKFPFLAKKDSIYHIYARIKCRNTSDDSFWLKMDEEEYESKNGLITSGWQWKKIHSYELTAGDHVFKIAYRENGAHLDKISISNYGFLPEDLGEVAGNICIPDTSSVGIDMPDQVSGIELFQNYPNPFAEKTNISFEISGKTFVSIKIYNLLGSEVKELINEVYDPGKYSIVTDMDNLTEGIYFYRMNAGNFTAGRKMILCPEY